MSLFFLHDIAQVARSFDIMNLVNFVTASSNTSDHAGCQRILQDDGNNEDNELPTPQDTAKQGGKSSNEECMAIFVASNDLEDGVDSVKALPMLSQDEENEAVSTDEEEDDDDDFNVDGLSMPRLSSSTVPIIVEVSNSYKSRGFYSSEDPLFQGVCLYSSTKDENKNIEGASRSSSGNITPEDMPVEKPDPKKHAGVTAEKPSRLAVTEEESSSWYTRFVPSMFRFLRFE